jgi:hypothetical protein
MAGIEPSGPNANADNERMNEAIAAPSVGIFGLSRSASINV